MSDRPIIMPLDNGLWKLVEEWDGIPAGFVTDGGSIPRFFWRVVGAPTDPQTCGPYIKHDWRYTTGVMSRKDADVSLYEDLRSAGVGFFRAKAIYYAVRICGESHYYNGNKEEDNA